jgi:hypothetical protein
MPDPGVPKVKGGRALRQVSAIGIAEAPQEVDGSVVRLEQLADLADALVAQVGAVREHYEQLQRTLETPRPEAVVTVGGAHSVEDPFVEPSEEGSDAPQVHDSARLVVMEMAMSGSTREETKAYLRETLELDGGDPVVDEVFDRTEAAQSGGKLHRRLFARRRD